MSEVKTIRGILIDPYESTIKYVDVPAADTLATCECINGLLNSDLFEFVSLGFSKGYGRFADSLVVDESGMLKLNENSMFIYAEDLYPEPIAGRGLLIGDDGCGGTCSVNMSVLDAGIHFEFLSIQQAVSVSS